MARRLRLAYLASSYPRAVDTAMRNEIVELRARGSEVHSYAIRRTPKKELLTALHEKEAASTVYLLSDRFKTSPLDLLRKLFEAPRRLFDTLALAFKTAPPGLKGLLWQFAYFLEAVSLAADMQRKGVMHLHVHIGENSASVGMLASSLSGIPYSMTIHGPYIFRAPERWALREKLVRSEFTACISHFTRSQCMIQAPLSHWGKLHVIRCAPERSFLGEPPSPAPDVPRLVWVGRVCEEKAVPVLLDAALLLSRDGVSCDLTLVGDGPLRSECEALIAARDLSDRVRITGWCDPTEVRKHILGSRALVLPSFAEGLPHVLMEALVLERPVISTYIAGIPELIVPGRTGWLVPAGSTEALAEAMREVLSTPIEQLREMGRVGREDVIARHHPATEAAKLENAIRQTLGNQ